MSLPVNKTYKLYIGGKFPRTESGRYFAAHDVNLCRGSRKDFRNAVVAARAAFGGWAGRSAYNRAQILYRLAEILEGRSAQFVDELKTQGASAKAAATEVRASIDCLVYYAGWADKVQQVFSSVNPVASSHFNFSMLEPTGVVAILAPSSSGLHGLVSTIAPAICGGNAVIALASDKLPLCAITFAEVVHASDVPGGVVNILTGHRDELLPHMAKHMDVNAVVLAEAKGSEAADLQVQAADNMKRVVAFGPVGDHNPYRVLDLCETKTTWHPVGL